MLSAIEYNLSYSHINHVVSTAGSLIYVLDLQASTRNAAIARADVAPPPTTVAATISRTSLPAPPAPLPPVRPPTGWVDLTSDEVSLIIFIYT